MAKNLFAESWFLRGARGTFYQKVPLTCALAMFKKLYAIRY
jgi:hypothetical protein